MFQEDVDFLLPVLSSTLAALMAFFMVRMKRSTSPLASGHKGVIR